MNTRSVESRGSLSSYRSSLRPAMRGIFTGPFLSLLMGLGPQSRPAKRWTLEYVIYVSVLMVLDESESLKDRFAHARQVVVSLFPNRRRSGRTYQGYVLACRRLHRRHRQAIQRRLREHHRGIAGPFWQRDGWVAFAADGTRVELPRTAANEKAFGCAGRDKTGPQLQLTSLYSLGTGLPWAWQIGAGRDPLTWSVAESLRQVRGAMRQGGRLGRGSLATFLRNAVKDSYVRTRSKSARNWPRKKKDHPPGVPKLRVATEKEKHDAQKTYEKTAAAQIHGVACHGYACVAMSCSCTWKACLRSVSMAPRPGFLPRRVTVLAWSE